MVKSVFLLILFSLLSWSIFSKNSCDNVKLNFVGYNLATLHFLDSTSIKGYAKIIDFLGTSKIKFKLSDDSKPDSWDERDVIGVTMHGALFDITFHYVKVKHISEPKLLEVVELGEISVYAKSETFWVSSGNSVGGFNERSMFPSGGGGSAYRETVHQLFVKSEKEAEAQCLEDAINFKKTAKDYFKNCLGILDKIDKREFKRGDTLEMVYYYNDYCAEL